MVENPDEIQVYQEHKGRNKSGKRTEFLHPGSNYHPYGDCSDGGGGGKVGEEEGTSCVTKLFTDPGAR